jgi:hypothetical protein
VTNLVRYVPTGQTLNLSALGSGDFALITSLHGTITRESGLVLECLSTGGDPAMYVWRNKDGRYWARHFPGAAHGSHEVVHESDEHRRQKEYHVRAAEAAGWTAETEFSTGKTRLDVRISGGKVPTGIEIQHSDISAANAKQRTTKSYRAGYTVAWFNDRGARPTFLREVPAYGCNALPWQERLPEVRAATATGLVRVEAVRCEVGAFERCPEGYARPCGQYHPQREPWLGLTVDDVAALVPDGQIVPVAARSGVYLTSPKGLARYQELTDGSGLWLPGSAKQSAAVPNERAPAQCENPEHEEFLLNPAVDAAPHQALIDLPWAAKNLAQYPGRCRFCGWHIQQMGHAPKCGSRVH